MRLTIIGGGRAAWAFGSSWIRAGWAIDAIVLRPGSTSRLPELLATRPAAPGEPIASEIVLVAVPDDALPTTCAESVQLAAPGSWLFHASGSHDSTLFGAGDRAFSLHPLRALPAPGQGDGLADALLVFEGSNAAEETARRITRGVGGRFARIPRETKPAYHAAAVIAANLVAVQLEIASDLMRAARLDAPKVEAEIADLARSAILNWGSRQGAERFTGPIARGDVQVVRRHLRSLSEHETALLLYRSSGLALCRKLRELRPDDANLLEIEALLSDPVLP